MSATEQFVASLTRMKSGELGLLRTHAGAGLDETVDGFDLFAGLWWPLRQKNQRAPRREVAWLVAKLYAFSPIPQSSGNTLASRLRQCQPRKDPEHTSFQNRFDRMLSLPLSELEPALQWALGTVATQRSQGLDWSRLTDDLSIWEREATKLQWARQYMQTVKEEDSAYRNPHDSEPQPRQPEQG
ncbi:MAG: type I-E CRISPR-associated protein Cse2/CasB [Dehalococcoidia bacterium]|nr:type I-E CRISPR-associated protein Cse2/CasB [Dehalococcoidia bacterium]